MGYATEARDVSESMQQSLNTYGQVPKPGSLLKGALPFCRPSAFAVQSFIRPVIQASHEVSGAS